MLKPGRAPGGILDEAGHKRGGVLIAVTRKLVSHVCRMLERNIIYKELSPWKLAWAILGF
jgi:hypothetical protein